MDAGLRSVVEERLGVEVRHAEQIDRGWDSIVFDVNGEWIVRVPRRPEVRAWLRKEAALLPLLAPALPVPVPTITIVEDTPEALVAAHRRLEGEPLRAGTDDARIGAQTGRFLAALHAFPQAKARDAGLEEDSGSDWVAELSERVTSLLDPDEQARARAMFGEFFSRPHELERAVIHADLGPEHLLARRGFVTGVIDWSDARIGDPGLDFAWLLHQPGESFAAALADAYGGLDDDLRSRALFYHRLGPWHEVLYGLEQDRPEHVVSGLAGIGERLP